MEVNRINSAATPPVLSPQAENRLQVTPELAQAVTAVNGAKLFGQDSELTFINDRETKRTIVQIVDKKTHKVIRQIPPKYLLDLAESLPKKDG